MGGLDPVSTVLAIYGGLGLAVAAPFLLVGIDRVDDAARGAYAVRPLLLPGLVMLWPVVAIRWAMLERRRRTSS
ncbi:MAG TPA: hypothetical protein VMP03_15275 [Methylomirabilota bacterium]|nr:hypothetical protein [Methylomirabilota bacterium]